MLKSVRINLAIDAYFNYEIWHMDVKMVLKGNLTEDVYIIQPEGFEDPNWKYMQTSKVLLRIEASILELEHSF
jgi:hypothetical protein